MEMLRTRVVLNGGRGRGYQLSDQSVHYGTANWPFPVLLAVTCCSHEVGLFAADKYRVGHHLQDSTTGNAAALSNTGTDMKIQAYYVFLS